ncbi:MAG: thermonuclease family protein [Bacilli bacterium]|nr:thermonuclease family protein [Bacilli bacterium]
MLNRKLKLLFMVVLLLLVAGCVAQTTTAPTTIPTTTTTSTTTESTTTTTTTTTTTAVTTTAMVALPDLTGQSREEITTTLTALNLTPKFYFDLSVVYDSDDEYDKFSFYGSELEIGSLVAPGSEIKVYTSPLNLELKYIYELDEYVDDLGNPVQLTEFDYVGREFIEDGIGVVTVHRFVDGDTTWFTSESTSFSVRYLGIDTPESTALYEPWGKAAAIYTRERLENAETIVLQHEGRERTDSNGRYLAWVWYRETATSDFVLLNLELVELAYSKSKLSYDLTRYTTVFTNADWDVSATKRRVWGEIDPAYDYTREGSEITIQDLMNNFEDSVGLKAIITGTVTRKSGYAFYIQDETGYGIYVYLMPSQASSQVQIGVNLTLGGLVPTYFSGSPQLTNFSSKLLWVNDPVAPPEPLNITYDDLTFNRIGTLVKMENLTITGFNGDKSSIYVRDVDLNSFEVRVDENSGIDVTSLGLTIGNVISVVGPMGYYDYDFDGTDPDYVYLKSNFQLTLTDVSDIVIE